MASREQIERVRKDIGKRHDAELASLEKRRAKTRTWSMHNPHFLRRDQHIAYSLSTLDAIKDSILSALGAIRDYILFALGAINDYCVFLVASWTRALWDIVMLPNVFLDRLAIISFAALASVAMFVLLLWCLFCKLPFVALVFDYLSKKLLGGASTANALFPALWDELSREEQGCAFAALSEGISVAGERVSDTTREVNLDAAKLLLQCAAMMYERTPPPLGSRSSDSETPEERDKRIIDHAKRYELEYITLSEMNSVSSTSCGLFFHPEQKFIIVAYKGTSPEEFGDWATDLTYAPKHAGGWIRGFDKCHGGFFSKVYPSKLERGVPLPYRTIQNGVRKVAEMLLENYPRGEGAEVNVWTTGHSLGCSLASLVYARQINEPAEVPASIIMRDAYLFAAPIVCDITSVNAFDNQMRHHAQPRTLWRMSNRNDIVAKGLPNMGDYPEWGVSASSAFSYAHLGAEIDLKRETCTVRGTHVTPGSDVNIVSKYEAPKASVPAKEKEKTRAALRKKLRILQSLPVLGQFIAHAPIAYWVALTDVSPGACQWEG